MRGMSIGNVIGFDGFDIVVCCFFAIKRLLLSCSL